MTTAIKRRSLILGLTTLLTALAYGCRRPNAQSGATTTNVSPADTVRGILQRVGSDPLSVLVLASATENAVFAIRGPLVDQLNRATGLEVMLSGTRSDKRDYSASPRGAIVFDVTQFSVRRADGQVAIDGVLNMRNGKYFLVTTAGEHKDIANLPPELRGHVGGRVFLVGALEKTPSAYGILSERK